MTWIVFNGDTCPVGQDERIDVRILDTLNLLNVPARIIQWNQRISHYRYHKNKTKKQQTTS